MIDIAVLEKLNAPTKGERLENLRSVLERTSFPPTVPQYVNNHIHTFYSFSPYSPTAAVYAARAEGLCTAGIVDHDSVAGIREFREAAKIVDMPATVGMECRASLAGTRIDGRPTNSPDQTSMTYLTIQSIPHDQVETLGRFFAPLRERRNERNRRMVANINRVVPGAELDFERDVLPLSRYAEGGGVTERHLMYALAKRMTEKFGRGTGLIGGLAAMGLALSGKQKKLLEDTEYPFYEYDLLGILKSEFVSQIYVDATDECPPLKDMVALCRDVDALLCYPYLGDVGESVTGDKKAQKFEDDYLDELFVFLEEEGIRAVTYMPTRNTREQLLRLRRLCDQYKMFQVSGEDINSPRQSFVIRAMEDPMFSNLIEATWKLIEHERTGGSIV